MIWESAALMTLFDLAMIALAGAAVLVLAKGGWRRSLAELGSGLWVIAFGLATIGIFYLFDLLVMHGLPLLVPRPAAMALMEALHRNYSWMVNLVGATSIFAGLVLTSRQVRSTLHKLRKVEEDLSQKLVEHERAADVQHVQLAGLKAAANAIVFADREGVIQWVNPAFTRLTGYSAEEAEGQDTRILRSGEQDPAFYRHLWDTILAGKVWHGELINRRRDGSLYIEEQTITPVCKEDGQVTHFIGIKRDITKRVRAEEVLGKAEDRYRSLFEDSIDAIYISRKDGELVDANPSFLDLFGYTKEELPTLNTRTMYVEAADREELLGVLEREGSVKEYELRAKRKDGTHLACLLTATVRRDEAGEMVSYQGILRDVTERTRVEKEASKLREELRDLATRLHSVREQEKTAIAREIHDEFGQTLSALKLDLSWLIDRLPEDREPVVERAHAAVSLVDTMLDAVRDLSYRLRPAVLDDLGLEAAIRGQAKEFEGRTGCRTELDLEAGELGLDRDRDTAIFRILQEALTNVARHSEARRVKISLRVDGDIVLAVSDDGRGISAKQKTSSKSLGLIGIRERARAFGGQVEIHRVSEEGGAMVRLRMPLSPKEDGGGAEIHPTITDARPVGAATP